MPLDFSRLHAIIAGIAEDIDAGVHQGAEYIGELAQQLAPEDTGALKASKQVDKKAPAAWVVSFGEGLPDIRAVVQEFGSIHQPAQPYLTPARQEIDVEAEVAARLKARIG